MLESRDEAGRFTCPYTGLVIVRPPKRLFRIYEPGPRRRAPLQVRACRNRPDDANRWDVTGRAIVYCAERRAAAFLETLQKFALVHGVSTAEDAPYRRTKIPSSWFIDCQLAVLRVHDIDEAGWFVDLTAAETLGALRRHAAEWLPPRKGDGQPREALDLSDIVGRDREVTCAAATWLASQDLATGTQPWGVRYASKLAIDLVCWAVWTPVLDENTFEEAVIPSVEQRMAADSNSVPIATTDVELKWAASLLNMQV
ncbi:RES domain-containing protein [Saccharothrix isguenensis]